MDNLTLAFLVKELREALCHRPLEKVQQISPVQLVLTFRSGRLLISADDQHPTLYLRPTSPGRVAQVSSPFLLLARKYLVGSRLDELQQIDHDRILRLHFTSSGEADQPHRFILVAELIDRRANLYLLNGDESIMARLIARQPESDSIGQTYRPPTLPGRREFSTLTEAEYQDITQAATSLSQALVRNLKGFSPLWAREVAWRAQFHPGYAAFRSLIQELEEGQPRPHIYTPAPLDHLRPGQVDWQKQLIVSPIPLHWPSAEAGLMATPFATMLEAVRRYEELVEAIRTFQRQKHALVMALRRQCHRARKRLDRIEEEMEQLVNYERDRRYGELLLANLHQAERHPDGFLVTDYYDPQQGQVLIPAQPDQTPQQAATAYFERYRQSQRKLEALQQQRSHWQQESARLDELSQGLDVATTPEQLALLVELARGHLEMPTERTPGQARTEKIPGIQRFQSSQQHEILVGRNAEANQRLTFKLARPHDLWLHAADYPGSHVILRKAKGSPIPFPSLVEAAELAAFFSQARHQGKVVVHYTERKYVHKVRGAAPAVVRLAEFKSITVEPRVRATRLDL